MNGSGNGLGNKKAQPNNGLNLNFGETLAQNSSTNSVEFMDKNYKLKNSDINKSDGASLFEIISNRYLQSGINRLFEEGK